MRGYQGFVCVRDWNLPMCSCLGNVDEFWVWIYPRNSKEREVFVIFFWIQMGTLSPDTLTSPLKRNHVTVMTVA